MTRYVARWGVWGPRELDPRVFISTLQASLPAGWRILEDDLVVSPERVTLVPHLLAPGETPPDPGTTSLEVQGGRYAGWYKTFLDAEATRLGASPTITGYRVPVEVPAVLDAAAIRAARSAINTALARYENQGFFGHNPGLTLRAVGASDAAYAALDRGRSEESRPGIGLAVAGLAIIAGLFFYTQDKSPPQRSRA